MLQSFVTASKDTPFSGVFKAYVESAPLEEWRDLFPGAGSVSVSEAVRNNGNFDYAEFEFMWGPNTHKAEFVSFQRRYIYEGFAVFEYFAASPDQRILVAFRPWYTGVEAMRCLERAIRGLNRKRSTVSVGDDGAITWQTHRKGDGAFVCHTSGKRRTDYFLRERWSGLP